MVATAAVMMAAGVAIDDGAVKILLQEFLDRQLRCTCMKVGMAIF